MASTASVRPLPWYGGKAKGRGAWIASLLPWEYESLYVEPFCGMANVWAQRAPVKIEILNDLNDRIVNWWRVCRDHWNEIGHLVEATPVSRKEHQWGRENLDNPDPVRRALAFYIVVQQGVISSDVKTGWAATYSRGVAGLWNNERVAAIAGRLRKVQLECIDAVILLGKCRDLDYSVVYADPPYVTAETSPYRYLVDVDALSKELLLQRGRVAISGYANEWNHLRWERHERKDVFHGVGKVDRKHAESGTRTEVLWTNYAPKPLQLEMFACPAPG